jgi:hypothetical protein
MPSNLALWQERLEKHFSSVRDERSMLHGEHPVFALEHGLAEDEISELIAQISNPSAPPPPSDRHWLVWTVYATELGYEYAGDEYWLTFEEKTPGWPERADRSWLRDCFWKFCKTYHGAKPAGAWARHFSIICWPISHAILPKDLQRQLAEILYQIRYLFRKELFDSPQLLGNEIAARSWMASPRFQILADEPVLLGQIAAALLIGESDQAKSLILPDTLLRIARNLDKERRSREWLKDARAAAKAKLSGLARAFVVPPEARELPPRQELQTLGIEPRVYLRPISHSWEVVLEIPDLAPLLSKFPDLHEVLGGTCVVTGSSGRPLARGRLLHYGPQNVVLKRWPDPTEILLQFERRTPQLENLLSAECMLRPGPNWLFKISAEGIAREIRGQVIRPGNKYILLNTGHIPLHQDTQPASVQCDNVYAARLDIPDVLSDEGLQHFVGLGLKPARHIDVRPAGLPPVNWDGEGHAEWLSSDLPCICVSSDHPIKALTFNLESSFGSKLDIVPSEAGERVFVALNELPPGDHILHVLAQSSSDEILIGRLDLTIRPPRPWQPALTEQNALFVIVAPPNPSLEQLWEGKVVLELQGPASRQASCGLSFSSEGLRHTPSLRKQLPPFSLPLVTEGWNSYFETNVRSDSVIQQFYDSASSCELQFTAEELGQFTLTCRREFSPLRWIVRWENHAYVLRLRDDTGDSATLVVLRYEFEGPDTPIPLSLVEKDHQFRVPESGGLFLARSTTSRRNIILPPLVRSLEDLRVEPVLRGCGGDAQSVGSLIILYDIWSEARITGDPLSAARQNDVLTALMKAIIEQFCGSDWLSQELAFHEAKNDLRPLKSAISRKIALAGFGAALMAKSVELNQQRCSQRVSTFSQIAQNYLQLPGFASFPANSKDLYLWIAEFVLRLMTAPQTLVHWAGSDFHLGIEYVLQCPPFARGGRFLTLALSFMNVSQRRGLIHPPGWDWQ